MVEQLSVRGGGGAYWVGRGTENVSLAPILVTVQSYPVQMLIFLIAVLT